MKFKSISLFVIASLIFSSCDSGKTKNDSYTLKFGHISSEDNTWHQAALKFKELVEERSQGKVEVKVYPNSQLGKEMDIINSIQLGTADMTITGESLQNWAPKAALMAVPYAFESSAQMRKAAGGPVGQEITFTSSSLNKALAVSSPTQPDPPIIIMVLFILLHLLLYKTNKPNPRHVLLSLLLRGYCEYNQSQNNNAFHRE